MGSPLASSPTGKAPRRSRSRSARRVASPIASSRCCWLACTYRKLVLTKYGVKNYFVSVILTNVGRRRDLVANVDPEYWNARKLLLAGLGIVGAVVLAYFIIQVLPGRSLQNWSTSTGVVSQTRISVSQIVETPRGTGVALQPQLQVTYSAAGALHTRWFELPARSDLTREQLDQKLAELVGRHVQVHWKPDAPLSAYVTEDLNSGATTQPAR